MEEMEAQEPSPSTSSTVTASKGQEDVEASQSSCFGGMMNPLDIPEIVGVVAGYIDDAGDLKSVRVLNNTWQKETFKKWRSSAVFLINDETFPVLLKAFQDSEDLTEESTEKAGVLANKDPFKLKEFPFKKYRFTREQDWSYPLYEECHFKRKLIWEKCLDPYASYLDLGECKLKYFNAYHNFYWGMGLKWILGNASNVTHLAMAPIKQLPEDYYAVEVEDSEYDDEYSTDEVEVIEENEDSESEEEESDEEEESLPLWLKNAFKAPQIISLTISSPQIKPRWKESSYFNCANGELTGELLKMLPNLKNLTLPGDWREAKPILKGLTATRLESNIRLESINAVTPGAKWYTTITELSEYLKHFENSSTLRELRVPVFFDNSIGNGSGIIPDLLKSVQNTLTKVELEVDCDSYFPKELPDKTDLLLLEGLDSIFPNLTHFKVVLDYFTFRGKLLTFDFRDLRNMPKLQNFYFGTKFCVDKSWVTRKLDIPQNDEFGAAGERAKLADDFKLPDLKSFHFHGSFKKKALQQLGRIMEKLETLELVCNEKTVIKLNDIWPGLRNLKLLPCSDVPNVTISCLRTSNPSLSIVDESEKYTPAIYCPMEEG